MISMIGCYAFSINPAASSSSEPQLTHKQKLKLHKEKRLKEHRKKMKEYEERKKAREDAAARKAGQNRRTPS